jgi:hypothetical protein
MIFYVNNKLVYGMETVRVKFWIVVVSPITERMIRDPYMVINGDILTRHIPHVKIIIVEKGLINCNIL